MATGLLQFSECRLACADHTGKKETGDDRQPISNLASGREVDIRRFTETNKIKKTRAFNTFWYCRKLFHCPGRFDESHVRTCRQRRVSTTYRFLKTGYRPAVRPSNNHEIGAMPCFYRRTDLG